jgi:hypothetical protein
MKELKIEAMTKKVSDRDHSLHREDILQRSLSDLAINQELEMEDICSERVRRKEKKNPYV